MRIENPDGRGLNTEEYWMVSRVAIVEEHYFDNEREAREFAATRPCFTVEAPVTPPSTIIDSKESGTHSAAGKEKE